MKLTRRDLCYLLGRRASKLPHEEAAQAWQHLAINLETLGDLHQPKFRDLTRAIRQAHLSARKSP